MPTHKRAKTASPKVPGSKNDTILLRLRAKDSPTGVSRETMRKLAKHYDVSETQLIHFALRGMANDTWPVTELEASAVELDRQFSQAQASRRQPVAA